MVDELVRVEVVLLPKKEKIWCADEVIPGVTEADEADVLEGRPGMTVEKLRTVEYAAKYLCCWRLNNFRPPQNSLRSSGQGMLHELSCPMVGSVTMASPQVPFTLSVVTFHLEDCQTLTFVAGFQGEVCRAQTERAALIYISDGKAAGDDLNVLAFKTSDVHVI